MRRAFALLLALLLVPAASAEAKFSAARVCGPSDCRSVTFRAEHQLMAMEKVAFSAESRLGASPPQASAWYRVTLCPERCDSPGALVLRVLPGVGYAYLPPTVWAEIIGYGYPPRKGWAQLTAHAAEVYGRVTVGLQPYPASSLVSDAQKQGARGPGHVTPVGAAPPVGGADAQPSSLAKSSGGGFPAWGWLAVIAALAAAAIALLVLGRLRR